jgi:translation initiation factor 2 subunit 2
MEYDKMLSKLYESLPKETKNKERFEMPTIQSLVQGPRTVVKNFDQYAKTIRRPIAVILKFLTRELATAASIEEEGLLLKGKFDQEKIQKILNAYVQQFVLCTECKKPDTKIIDQKGIRFLKCEACGASSPITG